MTKVEQIINGCLDLNEALELCSSLTKDEVIELLKFDLDSNRECNVTIDVECLYSQSERLPVSFLIFKDDKLYIYTGNTRIDVLLSDDFSVAPHEDYDTRAEAGAYWCDTRCYLFVLKDREGNGIGDVIIEI